MCITKAKAEPPGSAFTFVAMTIKKHNNLSFLYIVTLYQSYNFLLDIFIFNIYRILDLSFNRIKEITGLNNLLKLRKLYLSSNKINEIKNVNHLPKLESLELGDNRIRVCKH